MDIIFLLHSIWRWVFLVIALVAVIKPLVGWLAKQPWTALDDKLGLWYTIAFDIQFLLGLIVYLGIAFDDSRVARLYDASLMRLSMEHVLMMTIALVVAHIARARSKKAADDVAKHRIAAIGFIISLVLVIISLPTWSMTASL